MTAKDLREQKQDFDQIMRDIEAARQAGQWQRLSQLLSRASDLAKEIGLAIHIIS